MNSAVLCSSTWPLNFEKFNERTANRSFVKTGLTLHKNARKRWCNKNNGAIYASKGAGFHMTRLKATERKSPKKEMEIELRHAANDIEFEASAWLRAKSFYVYPKERKFAGELHQHMKAQEEFQLLKTRDLEQRLGRTTDQSRCVLALAPKSICDEIDESLMINDDLMVVGTLDVVVARGLDGQVLLGDALRAAYMANVCVSDAVRRRGVGKKLLNGAREFARECEVDALYVHMLAANEAGKNFYESCGFIVEQIESVNAAHMRGHCLDGVPGGARTMLMKDGKL